MYDFKITPELGWMVIVTVTGALATSVATQGAVPPTDWRAWAIGVTAAVVRALAGLILSKVPDNAARQ